MPIPIQELINESVRKELQRNKKEITSWHISKLGNCLRGVYLERLGKEPDEPLNDRTLRVFSVGNMFEDWAIQFLKKQKDIKLQTQIRVEDKELNISGYVDAMVEYQGEKKVYEIKSKHSKAFWYMVEKEEGAMRHHEYQLWAYLKLLNLPEGSLFYLSKDDLTVAEFPVKLNDKRLEEETMRNITILNECWKNSILPPLPDPKSWQAKFCPFHKQCLEAEEKLKNERKNK